MVFLALVVVKKLDQHGVVDIPTKRALYGFEISFEAVCG